MIPWTVAFSSRIYSFLSSINRSTKSLSWTGACNRLFVVVLKVAKKKFLTSLLYRDLLEYFRTSGKKTPNKNLKLPILNACKPFLRNSLSSSCKELVSHPYITNEIMSIAYLYNRNQYFKCCKIPCIQLKCTVKPSMLEQIFCKMYE